MIYNNNQLNETKMKKFVSTLILAITFASLNGQTAPTALHNELAGSYGIITTNQMFNVLKDIASVVFTFGNYDKENTDYSGGWFLAYKYAPNDNILLSITGGIDGAKGDLVDNDVKYGEFKTTYTSAIVGFDYRYLNKDFIQLYSGVGAGVTLCKNSGTQSGSGETDVSWDDPYFNFQVNLLGVRVGKALAGFAEFGLGYKGIINAGISYQF